MPHDTSGLTFHTLDPRDPDAVACLNQYFAELGARFRQGFEVHLSKDPEATSLIAPHGVFCVVRDETGALLGCGGVKGHGDWGEVKRVWVSQDARGRGIASALMSELEILARDLGHSVLRLDTNSQLPEAVALYRKLGWHEIDRFNDDPYPDFFFEKSL